jgi:hypothetical protein
VNDRTDDGRLNQLVKLWFAAVGEPSDGDAFSTVFDIWMTDPETTWQLVLEVLRHDMTDDQKAILAAGPLESLLANHGDLVIDRVERESATNSRFRHLLGGVWKNAMSDSVWERVQSVRGEAW